ncbi:MAG: hypothetical protein ABIJ37_10375 [Pseudomonadota bacterium]
MTEKKLWKEYIANIVFFLLIGLLIVFSRVFYGSITEYKKAEAAYSNSDYETALIHYERTVHWYTPFNKNVSRAAIRLWEIGNRAENEGNIPLALRAYRSLRSGFYSVRSVYTPGKEWIAKCDERLSTLVAKTGEFPSRYRDIPFENKKKMVIKTLKKNPAPDVFWSIVLEIGFIGWIGCVIGYIFRVFTGEKGFNGKRALFWGGFIIIFYSMWIVGMMRA